MWIDLNSRRLRDGSHKDQLRAIATHNSLPRSNHLRRLLGFISSAWTPPKATASALNAIISKSGRVCAMSNHTAATCHRAVGSQS
eukprot:2070390-Amphidinium_carterae.1